MSPEHRREGPLLQLVWLGYVLGSRLAQAVPERLAYRLAESLGSLWEHLSKRKRDTVVRNLARVTGLDPASRQLQRLVTAAYRSYARYWLETFRLARASPGYFLERFSCDGVEHVDEVLARGKGAFVVVGHLGNWDAAGGWLAATGRPPTTVAEVVRPRRLFEFFVAHRARLGMTVYPAVPRVTAKLLGAMQEGRLVAVLGDRDLRGSGPEVEFFGEPAPFPSGPAWVAIRAGVPILVAGVYGVELPGGLRGWRAHFSEPIELPGRSSDNPVAELTQQIASRLEGLVAARPEEWHVFQPFWSADRAEVRRSKEPVG